MREIVFDYMAWRGQYIPMIPIELITKLDRIRTHVMVDSGATYSIFHADIAEGLGLTLDKGEIIHPLIVDGKAIPVYLHTVTVRLGEEEFKARIGFSDKVGVEFNLLGRRDIFDRFTVSFSDKRKILRFIFEDETAH